MTDISVTISDDPVEVSVSNAPGPAGASSFFVGVAAAWPPAATPTPGHIYTLPDPLPAGTPAGYAPGYGAQWDGAAWNNIGAVRGPAGAAGAAGVTGATGATGAAGATGAVGATGSQGATGEEGAEGPAGTEGIAGPTGATGAAGAAGAAGATGPAGASGVISVTAPLTNSGTASAAALAVIVGTTVGTLAAGDDARLSDSRAPSGAAGGDLTGSYPNPTIAAGAVTDAKIDGMAASKLTGTVANARLTTRVRSAASIYLWSQFS